MKIICTILSACFVLILNAEDCSVVLMPEGRLTLGKEIRMEWRHNPAWRAILLKDGEVTVEGEKSTLSGTCAYPAGNGAEASYTLTRKDGDNWNYTATLRGIGDTKHISLEVKIPADRPADLEIGGTLFRLSGKKQETEILKWSPVRRNNLFRIVSGKDIYTLSGEFSVSISDLRGSTKENYYCIHFHVPESAREAHRFDMNIAIHRERPEMTPVSIAAAANMGFADPAADDGRGGWTDQGPKNDLAAMTLSGTHDFAGIPFEILDPAKNDGKSCIAVSGIRRFPPHGQLTFPEPVKARYLYLLHAAAWVPQTGEKIGAVELTFADDTTQRIPVIAGKDCGNWWNPVFPFENGQIGWTGDNPSGKVGLFVSAFRIPEKPLKAVGFLPEKSVWMIAGVSTGNLRPQATAEDHLTITRGAEWQPIDVPMQFKKGSAMDFSRLNRYYPAKDGALKIDEKGHFVLSRDPSKRLRFYGTNLGQDLTVPSHESADLLAERLAMEGFNSIRIHQFENRIYDWGKSSTLDFNPDKLDRFFYLWAKLREKGMYLTSDMLSTRVVRPGDGIEECPSSGDESIRKTLTMFSDSAMRNWKEFARKILLAKNPYTGLSMAEDPALFALNLDNEAPLYHTWSAHPELAPLVEKVYSSYLREKGLYTPEAAKLRGEEFYRFLKERQLKIQREQIRFLREELGVKAYITNLNNDARLNLQPFRYELDLTDGHIYHDHPEYPLKNWNVPISNSQKSATATGNRSMLANMAIRIPGRPMIVTELQFCYPNRFRSEIAILAGAYAALQDWDALYRFAAGHSDRKITTPGCCGSFDHYYEPLGILTGRIMHFLFVRGDVADAPGPVVTWGWDNPEFRDEFDPEFRDLGLFTRIGSAPAGTRIPDTLLLPDKSWKSALPEAMKQFLARYRKTGTAVSFTGEISFQREKATAAVVTPRSEVFSFPGGGIGGKFLEITNSHGFATISAHAFDDRELTRSRDILVYHLTDAVNSGTVFRNGEARLTLNNGGLPVLARSGGADVALNVDPDEKTWRVEAIALDGSVLGLIPFELRDGKLRFRATVFGPAGVTMLYRVRPGIQSAATR